MGKYRIGLTNPTKSFFDPQSGLHLDYYHPEAEVDFLSTAIQRGLKGRTLFDLRGNVGQPEAPEAPSKEEAAVQEEIVNTDKQTPVEDITEAPEEDILAVEEPKPQAKTGAKGNRTK